MVEGHDNIRALLVDDEEEFLTASSRALGRRGLVIDVAPNGVTALDMVDKNEYDIVVLDVKMPDIDGTEVFRIIRENHPNLPVILLTGYASVDDALNTSRDGVADYLFKPIDMDDLAERIREIITESAKGDEPDVSAMAETLKSMPVRVMLIDDEIEFLDSMKRVLERRGMEVMTADGGELGLNMLSETLVDVIVLDLKMPGMSGLDVLKAIKQKFPSIQIIVLTGHPSIDSALEAIAAGANEYMEKPPELQDLAATIRRLFEYRHKLFVEQRRKLIDDIRRRFPE